MAKKIYKYNKNSVIRGALRRAFARSPFVEDVVKASRKEAPRYKADGSRHKKNWIQRQCQVCDQWYQSSKISVDHIDPVVSVDEGFQDWNDFINRLWCDPSNLQRICDTCHDLKTYKERIERLLIKYTIELDTIEQNWQILLNDPKVLNKTLSKYTAKKNTIDLLPIVERALRLKDRLKTKKGLTCQKQAKH